MGNRVKPPGPMGTQLIPKSGMTGKNNDELFRIVMPMEVGNYIFINPADSLHQVRRSPSTLKKPVQVLTAAEKDQEAMEFTSFPI